MLFNCGRLPYTNPPIKSSVVVESSGWGACCQGPMGALKMTCFLEREIRTKGRVGFPWLSTRHRSRATTSTSCALALCVNDRELNCARRKSFAVSPRHRISCAAAGQNQMGIDSHSGHTSLILRGQIDFGSDPVVFSAVSLSTVVAPPANAD